MYTQNILYRIPLYVLGSVIKFLNNIYAMIAMIWCEKLSVLIKLQLF